MKIKKAKLFISHLNLRPLSIRHQTLHDIWIADKKNQTSKKYT